MNIESKEYLSNPQISPIFPVFFPPAKEKKRKKCRAGKKKAGKMGEMRGKVVNLSKQRKRALRKFFVSWNPFSRRAKITRCQKAIFRDARKFPAQRRTFSRRAKVSRTVQDVFAARESFPHSAGRFRGARKFPAQCRTDSRRAKVSFSKQ